jgi:hypothetical protein
VKCAVLSPQAVSALHLVRKGVPKQQVALPAPPALLLPPAILIAGHGRVGEAYQKTGTLAYGGIIAYFVLDPSSSLGFYFCVVYFGKFFR